MTKKIDQSRGLATPVLSGGTQLALPELDVLDVNDLDGWAPADLVMWLRRAMPELAKTERLTEAMRRATGLFLWKLRQDVGDGVYGTTVAALATEVGVTVRTMGRWRNVAEEHYHLPAASVRTVAQRDRHESKQVASAETPKQERVEGGDSQKGSPTRPGASGGAVATTEKVAEAEPAVPIPARGSTPSSGEETPGLIERFKAGDTAALAELMELGLSPLSPTGPAIYPQPVTKADMVAFFARLETIDDGMLAGSIEAARLAQQGKRLHRLGAPVVVPRRDDIVLPSVTTGCLHPPARRLGSTCSDCGCAVPKDAKWGRRAGRA